MEFSSFLEFEVFLRYIVSYTHFADIICRSYYNLEYYLNLALYKALYVLTTNNPSCDRRKARRTRIRNQVGQGAVVSHFEIIGGRRVLCEFKVSAGPCTRAKVANDSLGV